MKYSFKSATSIFLISFTLVVEGLLTYLITKAKDSDILLYVCMMVGILVLLIILVFAFERMKVRREKGMVIPHFGQPEEQLKQTFDFDVFLAVPMAALTDEEFIAFQDEVREITNTLKTKCGFTHIFYAGEKMKTKDDFESSDLSLETDLKNIRASRYFVMYYPNKIVSSVLYEAGIALALGKPSLYFGHKDNFPFLMQEAGQKFRHIKIYETTGKAQLLKTISNNGPALFKIDSAS